jgi:hypothetical protein
MEEIIKQENFTPDVAEWELEKAVDYVYDELNFDLSRQTKYYPRDNNDFQSLFQIIDSYYIGQGKNSGEYIYYRILKFLQDENLLTIEK